MGNNVLTTCNPGPPAPCRPAYLLTNNQVFAQVTSFAASNRGGTVGAQPSDYAINIEYHYDANSPIMPMTTTRHRVTIILCRSTSMGYVSPLF